MTTILMLLAFGGEQKISLIFVKYAYVRDYSYHKSRTIVVAIYNLLSLIKSHINFIDFVLLP